MSEEPPKDIMELWAELSDALRFQPSVFWSDQNLMRRINAFQSELRAYVNDAEHQIHYLKGRLNEKTPDSPDL